MKYEIWNMKYEIWNMKYEILKNLCYLCAYVLKNTICQIWSTNYKHLIFYISYFIFKTERSDVFWASPRFAGSGYPLHHPHPLRGRGWFRCYPSRCVVFIACAIKCDDSGRFWIATWRICWVTFALVSGRDNVAKWAVFFRLARRWLFFASRIWWVANKP